MCFKLMLSVVLNQLQAMRVPRYTSSRYVHVYFVDSSRNYSDVFQINALRRSQLAAGDGGASKHIFALRTRVLCGQ